MGSDVEQRNVLGSGVIQVLPDGTRDGDQQQTSGLFLKAAKMPKAHNTSPFCIAQMRCDVTERLEPGAEQDLIWLTILGLPSLLRYLTVS